MSEGEEVRRLIPPQEVFEIGNLKMEEGTNAVINQFRRRLTM